MADIMAANQTESVLSLLDRGEADSKTQQAVSAASLRALTKITEELQEIKGNLWRPDDLKRYIDERHLMHCQNCPAKKYADSLNSPPPPEKKEKPWYMELISSESIRYFILILILVWTIVAMRTTNEETAQIMENVKTTITGGAK